MKRLSTVFTVIFVSCALIGCAPPIGSIGGSGSSVKGKGDELIASPKRTAYSIPQKFLREDDLNVFISYKGILHTIPIGQVSISVIEDLSQPDKKNPVLPNEPYLFESPGQKKILVEYNNMSDEYYIDVVDPLDIGGGGNGGSDAPGIEVIWLY